MTTAVLLETLLLYQTRKAELALQQTNLEAQKSILIASRLETNELENASISELRAYYNNLYKNNPELQEEYVSYSEMPDFQEEYDALKAQFMAELEEISLAETNINDQITTISVESEEINTYISSLQTMLQSNIDDEYDFGGFSG